MIDVGKLPNYLLERSIVLEAWNVLYVPTPKAGCTTFLWWLAEIEGLSKERFYGSPIEQVSPALTIHDMGMWPERCKLLGRTENEIRHILTSQDWERVAIVRHPAERLFSAWQSKLLVREPQFYRKFSNAHWFPDDPTCADDILASFRSFVNALSRCRREAPRNAHWDSQADLLALDVVSYAKIGRVEEYSDMIAWMAQRTAIVTAGGRVAREGLPRANESLIKYTDGIYDGMETIVGDIYRRDFELFSYCWPRRGGVSMSEWKESADAAVPTISALIARHERIGVLSGLLCQEGKGVDLEDCSASGERVDIERANGAGDKWIVEIRVPRSMLRWIPVRVRRAILRWVGQVRCLIRRVRWGHFDAAPE